MKYRANETVEWYTARLVTKGFTQTYGVEYFETLAPVAKMNTVKVIIINSKQRVGPSPI